MIKIYSKIICIIFLFTQCNKSLLDDIKELQEQNKIQSERIEFLLRTIDSLANDINEIKLQQSSDYDYLLSLVDQIMLNINSVSGENFQILQDSIKNIRGDLIAVSLEMASFSNQISSISESVNSQNVQYGSLYESLVLIQQKLDSINAIPKKLFNGRNYRTNFEIQASIFKVSYNEIYEQPNWIEYKVRNVNNSLSRSGYDFYTVDSVFTSNIDDYADNVWDKGHLAPAASFSDTQQNLNATFSFLNCILQHYNLNRYEWAQLEGQIRDWSTSLSGDIDVKVEIIHNINHEVLPTGAHVPSAFKKTLTFPDNSKKCYYFPNQPTNGKDWTEFEIQCD